MNRLLLLTLLILVIGVPSVYAHPFLLDSEPSQAVNAPIGTTQIITKYSEAVEIDFSELKVFDSNGNQIDNGDTNHKTNQKQHFYLKQQQDFQEL